MTPEFWIQLATLLLGGAGALAAVYGVLSNRISGTPAPGETIWFRVFRNATVAADTYNQDARLLGVRLYFSTSKGNDA